MKDKRIEIAVKVVCGEYERSWINRKNLGIETGNVVGYPYFIAVYIGNLIAETEEKYPERKDEIYSIVENIRAAIKQCKSEEVIKAIEELEKLTLE